MIENALLLLLFAGLLAYVLLGRADFGAGIWEFNSAFQSSEDEKKLINQAIGPVWEANHVWLIFIIVILFTAFPLAFSALSQALWLPFFLALIGIVFRGAGFVFASHVGNAAKQKELWGAVFAAASTLAPFFLGAAFGAIASGRLSLSHQGTFNGDFLTDWISPLSIYCGFFFMGICAYLAAIYLTREAAKQNQDLMLRLWRKRALGMGLWMGFLALAGLGIMAESAHDLWQGFLDHSLPFVYASAIFALATLGGLWFHRFNLAVVAAALAIFCILAGWALAQYPHLIMSKMTIAESIAAPVVLESMFYVLLAGIILMAPAMYWLFKIFKFN